MKCHASIAILLLVCSNYSIAQEHVPTEDQPEPLIEERGAIVVASSDEDGMGTRVMSFSTDSMGDGPLFMADGMDTHFEFTDSMGGNNFSLLNNPSVQKDLQLVDEQMDQIREINEEFGSKIQDQISSMRDEKGNLSFSGGGSELATLIKDLQQQQQDKIQSILLPNQQTRLEQVSRQMKMKRMGTERTLTKLLSEELGLTEEQTERIKSRARKLQKEVAAKMAEIRADAKEELLSELTSEQRDKLKELTGDTFVEKDEDLDSNDPRRFMRRNRRSGRDF